MASNLAVLTTFVAITSCFVLFASEHRSHTRNVVGNVTRVASSDSLTKGAIFFSDNERKWIEAGRQRDVGWLMAFSDLQHGQSSVDQFVHHIQESPANVLLIDSISDKALATISQMPRLRALVIHNSDVSDAGLKHLLKMSHLETVGFYYCEVTQEAVDRLRQLMPGTRIEIYNSRFRGFVFDGNGCLATPFRRTYMKPSSWR